MKKTMDVGRYVMLEGALRDAMDNDALHLHYQPQVAITSGRLVGVEALLRWTDPEFGTVSPVEFIPIAEHAGLIEKMGEWVLRTACRQIAGLQEAYESGLAVAVNLSPLQLTQPSLVAQVRDALTDSGLPASRLELEITESVRLPQDKVIAERLASLRDMGVSIALDDFGVGFSNLSSLIWYPVDTLKIDGALIRPIPDHPRAAAILQALIGLTRELGIRCVVECVESDAQLAWLASLMAARPRPDRGRDCTQGFFFSRPVTLETLTNNAQGLREELRERARTALGGGADA